MTATDSGVPGAPDLRGVERSQVFVAGAGIMGSGIAAQAALAGYPVTLEDLTPELAQRGRQNVAQVLEAAVTRGKVAEAARVDAMAKIEVAVGLQRADMAEIVVEAAPEQLELKRSLFRDLEQVVAPTAILVTNTSSIPITAIGSPLHDPGRLVGIHFFNPVLQMPLVELIPGPRTRPEVVERAREFATSLGKTVVQSKDTPGFVTTRALAVELNEAAWMLDEGVSTKEEIDTAYKLGFHHPMGPFELADLVGLDTALAILDVLWEGFHDPKYRACPLIRTMVDAKKLGRKTGEGFYTYPARSSGPSRGSSS